MKKKIHNQFRELSAFFFHPQLYCIASLLIINLISSISLGTISTTVLLRDSNAPLELANPNIPYVYRDIMVGTRLKIIVSSDTDEYWWGGSLGFETVPNPGLLTARGPENFGNWEGSCLPAAGTPAGVGPPSYLPEGFDMYPGSPQTISPGDWFVIDYNAMETGECNVAFYNYQIDEYAPLYYLSFSHVPSRDFNEDKIVNFEDYRILLDQWLASCSEPQWCDGADIDTDGFVDVMDLKLFCEFWLEETQ